jgi:thiamine biosynthesis protein ThiS
MTITVNGEARETADGQTVLGLLEELKLQPGATVVERNAAIVDRDAYASTALEEGDTLELVRFVGGG